LLLATAAAWQGPSSSNYSLQGQFHAYPNSTLQVQTQLLFAEQTSQVNSVYQTWMQFGQSNYTNVVCSLISYGQLIPSITVVNSCGSNLLSAINNTPYTGVIGTQ
jgi:hypothetical protein